MNSEKLIVNGAEINYKKKLENQNQKPQLRELTQEETNIINTNIDLGNKIVNSFNVEESVTNELRILDIVFKIGLMEIRFFQKMKLHLVWAYYLAKLQENNYLWNGR